MSLKTMLAIPLLRKVPEVTIFFWVIKLLTTAMGEATSDFMVHSFDPVFAVLLGFAGFLVAIALQFWTKKYVPWIYWLAVTMVAVFGTMAADVVHIALGVPYLISTCAFAIVLGIIFILWYQVEHTLSIHSITTYRREAFYWLTIIATFALGTALGDMTAITLHLGYLASGILFTVFFALPLLIQQKWKGNEVLTFWAAYLVTRPLGASFADWFGRTPNMGGIGMGTGTTSLVLIGLIILFVTYVTIAKIDRKTATN